MLTFVAKKQSHKVLGQAKRQSRAMSVRNPNYQQVHDLYELYSDGRSLQEFCRMSGVSYQKYLEWERNQAISDSSRKSKSISELTVGVVTIPDAPSVQSASKPKELSIRDLNVRLSNGTYKS